MRVRQCIMDIKEFELSIDLSCRIHHGSTSALGKSGKREVSKLAKMIFWRVLLHIIIYHLDTYVSWGKVFYLCRTHYVC